MPIKLNRAETRKEIVKWLKSSPELSDRVIAKSLGCSHSTVNKVRKEMTERGEIISTKSEWLNHPYLKAHPELLVGAKEIDIRALKAPGVLDLMAERGLSSPRYAQRVIHREKKRAEQEVYVKLTEKDCTLLCEDIRDGLPQVADKSVDLILVDPPYAAKYVSILEDIGRVAERVLKDDGNLVVMYGNRHLPSAMELLDKHMKYHWTLVYLTTTGGSPPLHRIGVSTQWKPLLWYRKSKHPYKGDLVYDIINTGKPIPKVNRTHKWEQNVDGMSEIIKRFTLPGQTVLDCCCGSGTTGVAAMSMGRKFIGSDIDMANVELSKDRLAKLLLELHYNDIEEDGQ